MTTDEEVLYEERNSIAVITLNRPERKNAMTEAVIDGIADGIDAATLSDDVRAIVLRGAGDTFAAGYDLNAETDDGGWSTPYGAPLPEGGGRPGAWDPVRDWQSWADTSIAS